MKQIIREEMVKQTTTLFVADDGKEFTGENAERECRNYEAQIHHDETEKKFKPLVLAEFSDPFADWMGETWNYIVRFESAADYWTMRNYFSGSNNWNEVDIEEPKEYPVTMLVMYNGDSYYEQIKNPAYFLEKTVNVVNNLKKYFAEEN